MLERLNDLYTELNMSQESIELKQEIKIENEKDIGVLDNFRQPFSKVDPVKRTKVNRNEPCICGSGKKYKKCCGKG